MRKLIFSPVYCVLFLCLALPPAKAQQVFKTTATSVIGYLEYVPQDYNANSDKYPVVIFLHGIGERGTNSTDPTKLSTTIQSVAKLGPPMYVKNGTQFPFILISPQLKNNYGTWPVSYVMEVINHVKSYLRIDEKRIFLTGLSLGGGGVWMTAQDYPELFAAIAPVCGGYNTLSKACNIASENLPVWAFHGDIDDVVPLSRTVNMVNAINNCTPKPNPLAKISIYAGVKHSAWSKAYKTDNSVHNPNLYQWMMSYTNTINKGNKIPVANAGNDLTASVGSSHVITGSGSDPDGSITSYSWTQISGPTGITLLNKLTKALTVSGLVSGTYMFRLTVKDNSGNTDSDYVKVTVSSSNTSPVANAGSDKSITLPTNSVTITGSGTDPDGTITAYAWSEVSGSTVTLSGTTTTTLSATNLVSGSYVFRLTVTDNTGAKKSDDMTLTVSSSGNKAPVANAGGSKTITLPDNAINLTGSGTDADGTISYYKWSKLSGPNCYIYGVSKPTLQLSQMEAGTYSFRLTVTDNKGATGTDEILVTVQDPSTSTAPSDPSSIANAGPDKTITLPTNALNLTGSAPADGGIYYYKWSKLSGPYCYIYGVSKPTLQLSQMKAGVYLFRLTVTDKINGITGTDEVTVTVKDGVTSATSFATESVSSQLASVDDDQPVLGDMTTAQLENSTVVIYDDAGERIYSGSWSSETYRDVLNKRGLYVYNVISEGRRMKAGKIYIRN